ncbi:toluene tolerance protein [Mycobacterium sp. IS-1496]|nr:toluene tolerance protein [Mycobacterium sp. IS-1496]
MVAVACVFGPAASGWAAPPDIPAQPAQAACSYRLDPPRRIDQPSGTAVVATTMSVTGCRGEAFPVEVTACIRADEGTQCRTKGAWLPASLEFRPWRPGSTYTATGRGCALLGNPPTRVCTPMGPVSVVL